MVKKLEYLVENELNSANAKFPLFTSAHEGYAVLLEEVQECAEESTKIQEGIDTLWFGIRQNKPNEVLHDVVRDIKTNAMKVAAEAIQVAAMCDKYGLSLGGEPNE